MASAGTAGILDRALELCPLRSTAKSAPSRGCVTSDDVVDVWLSAAAVVDGKLRAGRASALPGLGTFSFTERGDPTFIVDPALERSAGVRQAVRRAAKTRAAAKLNPLEVSMACARPVQKDSAKMVLSSVAKAFRETLVGGAASAQRTTASTATRAASLRLGNVGVLSVKGNALNFVFDPPFRSKDATARPSTASGRSRRSATAAAAPRPASAGSKSAAASVPRLPTPGSRVGSAGVVATESALATARSVMASKRAADAAESVAAGAGDDRSVAAAPSTAEETEPAAAAADNAGSTRDDGSADAGVSGPATPKRPPTPDRRAATSTPVMTERREFAWSRPSTADSPAAAPAAVTPRDQPRATTPRSPVDDSSGAGRRRPSTPRSPADSVSGVSAPSSVLDVSLESVASASTSEVSGIPMSRPASASKPAPSARTAWELTTISMDSAEGGKLQRAVKDVVNIIDGFKAIDTPGNGYVVATQLQSAASRAGLKLTPPETAELLREAGADGDGRLELLPFVKMCRAQRRPSAAGATRKEDAARAAAKVYGSGRRASQGSDAPVAARTLQLTAKLATLVRTGRLAHANHSPEYTHFRKYRDDPRSLLPAGQLEACLRTVVPPSVGATAADFARLTKSCKLPVRDARVAALNATHAERGRVLIGPGQGTDYRKLPEALAAWPSPEKVAAEVAAARATLERMTSRELSASLKAFDYTSQGRVAHEDVRQALRSCGVKLSRDAVALLCRDCEDGDGLVNADALVATEAGDALDGPTPRPLSHAEAREEAVRLFNNALYDAGVTLERCFARMDSERVGRVHLDDLEAELAELGVPSAVPGAPRDAVSTAAMLFARADRAGSGAVTLDDVWATLAPRGPLGWEADTFEVCRRWMAAARMSVPQCFAAWHGTYGERPATAFASPRHLRAMQAPLLREQFVHGVEAACEATEGAFVPARPLIATLFDVVDRNRDGKVDVHEFARRFGPDGASADKDEAAFRAVRNAMYRRGTNVTQLVDAIGQPAESVARGAVASRGQRTVVTVERLAAAFSDHNPDLTPRAAKALALSLASADGIIVDTTALYAALGERTLPSGPAGDEAALADLRLVLLDGEDADASEKVYQRMRRALRDRDGDGTGHIERDAFCSALRECAPSPLDDAQVGALVDIADANDDGRIDYDEFVDRLSGDARAFVPADWRRHALQQAALYARVRGFTARELFERWVGQGTKLMTPVALRQGLRAIGVRVSARQALRLAHSAVRAASSSSSNNSGGGGDGGWDDGFRPDTASSSPLLDVDLFTALLMSGDDTIAPETLAELGATKDSTFTLVPLREAHRIAHRFGRGFAQAAIRAFERSGGALTGRHAGTTTRGGGGAGAASVVSSAAVTVDADDDVGAAPDAFGAREEGQRPAPAPAGADADADDAEAACSAASVASRGASAADGSAAATAGGVEALTPEGRALLAKLRDALGKHAVTTAAAFEALDADGDGFLSRDEFAFGVRGRGEGALALDAAGLPVDELERIGFTKASALAAFDAFDDLRTGFLDGDAFAALLLRGSSIAASGVSAAASAATQSARSAASSDAEAVRDWQARALLAVSAWARSWDAADRVERGLMLAAARAQPLEQARARPRTAPHSSRRGNAVDLSSGGVAASFAVCDASGAGVLSATGLQHGLRALGVRLSDEQAAALLGVLDGKGDGVVDVDEWGDHVGVGSTWTWQEEALQAAGRALARRYPSVAAAFEAICGHPAPPAAHDAWPLSSRSRGGDGDGARAAGIAFGLNSARSSDGAGAASALSWTSPPRHTPTDTRSTASERSSTAAAAAAATVGISMTDFQRALGSAVQELHLLESRWRALFARCDADGDGVVSANEFRVQFARFWGADAVRRWAVDAIAQHHGTASVAFSAMDSRGDGCITVNDFTRGLKEVAPFLSASDIARLWDECEALASTEAAPLRGGCIDLKQFLGVFTRGVPRLDVDAVALRRLRTLVGTRAGALYKLLRAADADGAGFVSAAAFKACLQRLNLGVTAEQSERLVRCAPEAPGADADASGGADDGAATVNYGAFMAWLRGAQSPAAKGEADRLLLRKASALIYDALGSPRSAFFQWGRGASTLSLRDFVRGMAQAARLAGCMPPSPDEVAEAFVAAQRAAPGKRARTPRPAGDASAGAGGRALARPRAADSWARLEMSQFVRAFADASREAEAASRERVREMLRQLARHARVLTQRFLAVPAGAGGHLVHRDAFRAVVASLKPGFSRDDWALLVDAADPSGLNKVDWQRFLARARSEATAAAMKLQSRVPGARRRSHGRATDTALRSPRSVHASRR